RMRFLTSYPKDMTERIIDAVAELPKVCEYFNIPVQSGDDTVLDRMRRGYTIAEYREKFDLIRRAMPGAAITTDLIVGFCGETDAEFQRSYDLLAELAFDKVHVAAYSPRPGTIAYRKLEDDVPQEVKMARLHAVEQLEAGISGRINSRLVGREVEVLVEGRKPMPVAAAPSPEPALIAAESLSHDPRLAPALSAAEGTHDPRTAVALFGRTRGNKLVHFSGDARPGDLATVRIDRASPWSLVGTAVVVGATP
ncbi:MAG: radical SAM protein, partial [Hyphomicrobium sp.]